MQNKTIIISRTDSIGDVMLTLPLAGILKDRFPGSRIIFLGKKYTRAVISCCEHVDEFADWDEIQKATKREQTERFRSFRADVIVHVFPDRHIARLAKEAGIPTRIGTSHRLFHWGTCNRKVNFSRRKSDLHEAQLNVKLLQPLGITGEYSLEELAQFSGFTRVKALPGELKSLLQPGKFNLILHPRSKGSAREWGLDNFSALIAALPQESTAIFITGTREEGASLGALFKKHPHVTDLTGKLSLDELVSFIHSCDGLVAASTGPLHIAAACGKKAIGLFAPLRPIHPGRWAPIGKQADFLVLNKSCNDCKRSRDCHCIRELSPLLVKQKLCGGVLFSPEKEK